MPDKRKIAGTLFLALCLFLSGLLLTDRIPPLAGSAIFAAGLALMGLLAWRWRE